MIIGRTDSVNLPEKYDPDCWAIRLDFEAVMRRLHWWLWHSYRGTLTSPRQREQQRLAREAEELVARHVRTLGYQAYPTTHKCPFDLWVADQQGRAIRVEVKISLYHESKAGGRYQADVRQHHEADLLVFITRNGRDWPFVIPMADIAPRRNVAIWSYCPADYTGQWARYLGAWEYLRRAIETIPPQPRQLSLSGL